MYFCIKQGKMKKYALIVAGGNGSRMESAIPKQFLMLLGRPILFHTLSVFHRFDPEMEIILALPKDQIYYWKKLVAEIPDTIPHQIVEGGSTRFESVKNALRLIDREGIVFIHDGVRPLVSLATLTRCLALAIKKGTAIPVLPVNESIRQLNEEASIAVDRSRYVSVQTPQVFRTAIIIKAYNQEYLPEFTDDASVVEKLGFPISLTEGNLENIKITHPSDLLLASALMESQTINH